MHLRFYPLVFIDMYMYSIINNKTYTHVCLQSLCTCTFIKMFGCKLCSRHPSFLSTRLRSSSSSSVDEVHVPKKWRATKCPRDKFAGDKVPTRRNGWRQSVHETKWLATKCPRDETAGDKVYMKRNGWRRSVPATKWQATKRQRRNDGDKTTATNVVYPNLMH